MNRKLILIIIFGIVMRILFFTTTVDDAFITFRYAQNLAEGNGFVYNVGEQVLGITNPLYGLIITLALVVGINPIIFSKLIGLVCYILISLLGWKFLKTRVNKLSAYAFVVMFAIDHYTSKWFMSGMETALFSLVIFSAILLFLDRREKLAGVLAGISIYLRPEGIFLLALILLASRKKRNVIPGIMIAASFFLFNQLFYGFPIPYSIYVKTSQAGWGVTGILKSGYHIANSIIKQPFPVFLTLFSGLNIFWILALPLMVFASYFVLGTPVFFWYYAPYYPLIFLVAGVGLCVLNKRVKPEFREIVIGGLLVFMVIHQLAFTGRELYLQQDSASKFEAYKEFALSIASDEGAILVASDIGVLGYYSEHYLFDVTGLVSPKAVGCWRDGTIPECISELDPDYFVVRKGTIQEEAAILANCTNFVTESRLHRFYSCD